MSKILYLCLSVVVLAISISVHETAHACAAYFLGDDTARARGRVSLNPLDHIDPFGTVLLPLIMLLAGGPIFAFAKPVPIFVNKLKNPQRDEVLIALAGPLSNILLAVLGAIIYGIVLHMSPITQGLASWTTISYVVYFFSTFISVNLSLAFFNLIPLPPLDGSSIVRPFLHGDALQTYYKIQQYSMPILIIGLCILPYVFHIDLISIYFKFTVDPFYNLLVNFALSL